MSRYSGDVLIQLDRVFNHGSIAALDDDRLLKRFIVERDEEAFAGLVARHGRMVLGVCRRILHDEHDVEDAFQATFLVLMSRAEAIRDGGLLGHWIFGVAHRVAVRARANAAQRFVHEQNASATRAEVEPPSREGERRELRAVLEEELARLPETLSAPIVLCYLEGLTHEEAAARLRWPVGTVRSRLARARLLLHQRLSGRGLTADDACLAAAFASQPVPLFLIDATVRVSLEFTATQAKATALATSTAIALARGVLQTMMISKLKILGAATLACAFALGGLRTYALQLRETGDQVPAGPGPQPRAEDRQQALSRSLAKIQGDLDQSERINAALQKELNDLRAELENTRRAAGSRAVSKIPPSAARSVPASDSSRLPRAGLATGSGGISGSAGIYGSSSGTFTSGSGTGTSVGGPVGAMGMPGGFGGGLGGMPMGGYGGGMGGMPMGGFGGGMVMGGAGGKNRPRYMQTDQLIVVSSADGDRVTAYSTETGKARSLRLAKNRDSKFEVAPVLSQRLAALYLKGPNITRIAAFSVLDGTWYAEDLREPAAEAAPIVSQSIAAYSIGRRVYAFSALARRWDVLELPAGVVAQSVIGNDAIICDHDDHLYVFRAKTGKWEDIDTRAADDQDGG
jgi:RNA polymerase sigma factor (sigma-70 family)